MYYNHVFIIFNTSHKFWDQSPSPHYQRCLQVSETVCWHKLRCCYSTNMLQHWAGGRDLIYFCEVDHSRISINVSRNWLGLNNLCEILWLAFRKGNNKLLQFSHWHVTFQKLYRSSRPEVFCKKSVLRSFGKFTGKHLCKSQAFIEHFWWLLLIVRKSNFPYQILHNNSYKCHVIIKIHIPHYAKVVNHVFLIGFRCCC